MSADGSTTPLHDLTAEELARRAQAGSSDAFSALVDRFAPRLLRYLRRRNSQEDAEDLSQDTFVRAHRYLQRYDPQRPFGTWLFTIATRLALRPSRRPRISQAPNLLRLSGHSEPQPHALDNLDESASPNAPSTPLDLLARREAAARLWADARRVLSDAQYRALWHRYGADLSIEETARAMAMRPTAVKVLLHRARKRLLALSPPDQET